MRITTLSESMLSREMACILAGYLDFEVLPDALVRVFHSPLDERTDLIVRWGAQEFRAKIDGGDLGRSLDDFSNRYLLPAAMELCGLPLLDGDRIVVNAAHDERAPA